jgi:tetratricopeptide (TPR) repeat protein
MIDHSRHSLARIVHSQSVGDAHHPTLGKPPDAQQEGAPTMRGKWKERFGGLAESGGKNHFGDQMARNRASDLIRSAERFIGDHRYDIASEQLESARRIDPTNPYIPAILARVQQLKEGRRPSPAAGTASTRYLDVTVGSEFASGIRPEDPASHPLERWVASAEAYLQRGAFDNAFEALMNAYMIDPVNPLVMACEERVLPAWQKAHAAGKTAFARLAPITTRETRAVLSAADSAAPSGLPQPMLDQLSENARLEILHQQKEAERLRREQAVWRDASRWRGA